MADIGKSTTAHSEEATESARRIERLLTNWGDWLNRESAPMRAEIAASPTFREYVAGYRTTGGRALPEDVDVAMLTDQIMATLSERSICCLHCNYVMHLSSRKAARLLSSVEQKEYRWDNRQPSKTLKCSHVTYRDWLTQAINEAERKVTFATGLEFDNKKKVKKLVRKIS